MYPEALSDKQKKIFPKLKNFNDFYLAGGTALALQIGHRISIDFDLFSEKEIAKESVAKVKRIFSEEKISISVNNPDELTVFVNETKISFLRYPFPVLFDFIDFEGVKLLSIKEIVATKAYSLGRRGSYKDYVDLYFILYKKHSSLNEILEISKKKFGNEFNGRLFLEQLIYLEDIEETGIIFLGNRPTKKVVKKFFMEEVKKIKL